MLIDFEQYLKTILGQEVQGLVGRVGKVMKIEGS